MQVKIDLNEEKSVIEIRRSMKNFIKSSIKKLIFILPNRFEKVPIKHTLFKTFIENIENIELERPKKSSGPDQTWYQFSQKFKKDLSSVSSIENFLRSPVILETMNEVFLPVLMKEYFKVKVNLRKLGYNFKSIIVENTIGNQIPFFYNRSTSGNLIHHFYHITEFILYSNLDIKKLERINEFGGGYGNMCKVAFKLGFNGTYNIFDLDLFIELQKFYLSACSLRETKSINFNKQSKDKVIKENSLLIATWSLSETDLSTRKKYQSLIDKSSYILVGLRDTFEGVDNLRYFNDYMKTRKDLDFKISGIKGIPRSYYLFAKPKTDM